MSENFSKQEEDPTREWIDNEGLMIQMILVPQKSVLVGTGTEGIDPSMVQVYSALRTRRDVRHQGSEFVKFSKGNVNKLLKAQFDTLRRELLDRHFSQNNQDDE